jgi:MFS family permease
MAATAELNAGPDHDPYAALRHGAFWLYATSYVLAVISSAMLSTAASYDVHQLTRDSGRGPAFYLMMLALTAALPVMLLSLLAGHVVDRVNRKTVLLCTQLALTLMPLVYALIAWRGVHSVWSVYGIVLVNAVALTFARPTRTAIISTLVPRRALSNAITWNSSIAETSSMAGPAIAGLLIAMMATPLPSASTTLPATTQPHGYHSVAGTVLASAVAMFICFVVTLFLPRPPDHPGQPATWRSLVAGVRFVFHTRLLFASMSLDLFAVLFGGATYLMPIFAERLGVGPEGFGLMRSAPAVGAITMGLIQAHRRPWDRAGRAMLLGIAGFGVATIVFGLSQHFWLSMGALVAIGACDNINVVVRHSLVQLLTPDPMRGRVGAVNQVFIGASNELGGVESGITADLFGPVASVVGGGIATLGVVATVAWRFPEVLRLGRLRDVQPAEMPVDEPTLRSTTEAPLAS